MKQLFIEQYTNTGEKKVWKLGTDKHLYTFGRSRTADIVSIDNDLEFWEGVFEFKNDSWSYVSTNSMSYKSDPSILLESKTEVKFKTSTLNMTVISKSIEINKFQIQAIASDKKAKKFQVYQVCYEDQVIETQIIPFPKKFISNSVPGSIPVNPIPSSSWHISKLNEFILKQKTIEAEKPSQLFFLKMNDIIDRDSRAGMLSLLFLSFIFIAGYFFIPKTETYVPVSKKTNAMRLFIAQQPIKKEKPKAPIKDEAQKVITPVDAPKTQATGDIRPHKNKIAGMLKSFNTGRISSLISKVSAQGQRSKTVVISDGILAGSGASGRALAGLGKIEKSGSDWNQDNGSKGFRISTNGIGGGKNVNSFATLSGGKVGKGGVGLIEDESEVVGGLDREEIASYIRTQLGQILYCYERQLSANKELFGKVSVKFTINGSGKVETQTVSDTTLKNTTVEGCMLNKIASWKFPAPRGGTKVIVTYPFLFKSTN